MIRISCRVSLPRASQSCIRWRIQRAVLAMDEVYSGHRFDRLGSGDLEIRIQLSVTAQAAGPGRGELPLKLRGRADHRGEEEREEARGRCRMEQVRAQVQMGRASLGPTLRC